MADGSAQITFDWGDGKYLFRLPLAQLRELQDKTNAGPLELLTRIRDKRWRIDDLRETIRLGLIGGGLEPTVAFKLVERYTYPNFPATDSVEPAQKIILAALVGADGDPAGKPGAAKDQTEQVGSSLSPPSMEPAQQ